MSRPHKPDNYAALSPYLVVNDPQASIDFYKNAFGFELIGEPLEMDGKICHVSMTGHGATIMFGPEGGDDCPARCPLNSGEVSPIVLYLYVENVDDFVANAKANGAEVKQEPEDAFWGDRFARLKDPNGYDWSFATNIGEFDASKIPASV